MTNPRLARQGSLLRAFTLVEILVVVGILTLLAAILFPVFSNARENARRTTCNSNLRQIGIAMGLYVQDNKGFYPPFQQPTYSCRWSDCIAPYLKSPAVFECPSLKDGRYEPTSLCYLIDEKDTPAIVASMDRKVGSYDLNKMIDLWQAPTRLFASEVRLRRPESIILALDGNGESSPYSRADDILNLTQEQDLLNAGMKTRHKNGNNVLFVDGHVKWMTLASLAQGRLWRATMQ